MNKLIYANISRLLKSKVFILSVIAAVIISCWIVISFYPQDENTPEYVSDMFFNFYQLIGIFSAVGISLTLGTEYSDGAIRNKLIIGHNRNNVYFSYLIVNIIFTMIILAVHMLVTCSLGYFMLGMGDISIGKALAKIGCSWLAAMVYAAFFTMISANCPNKAVNAVICMIMALLMIVAANYTNNQLLQPEMTYDGITITQDGIEYGDYVKNPAYVSGAMRNVLMLILDVLPSGQLIQLQSGNHAHIAFFPIYSAVLFAALTFAGCIAFKKRDIS